MPVIVTGVPPAVVPDTGEIPLTVGAGFPPPCPLARNVAICINHGVDELNPPVAP